MASKKSGCRGGYGVRYGYRGRYGDRYREWNIGIDGGGNGVEMKEDTEF